MTCCRCVADSFGNLQQKNSVLDSSVADVADVAGFFNSSYEREKNLGSAENCGNLSKTSATSAASATAPTSTALSRCRSENTSATDLQHGGHACP
jgi:hypothetical protein